jgi:hypothetical protein
LGQSKKIALGIILIVLMAFLLLSTTFWSPFLKISYKRFFRNGYSDCRYDVKWERICWVNTTKW